MIENLRFFLGPYRRRLAWLFVCQIGSAMTAACAIAAIAPVVSAAIGGSDQQGALVGGVRWAASVLPVNSPLAASLIVMLLLTVIAEAAAYGTGLLANRLRAAGVRDCMVRSYEKVLHADYQYFLDHRHSDLTHLVMVAAYNTQTLFQVVDLAGIGLQIVAVLFLLWTVSPVASLGVAVAAALAYGLLTAISAGRLIALGEAQRLASRAQSRSVDEAVRGMRFLRVFETADLWRTRFRDATRHYTAAAIRQEVLRLSPGTITSIGFVWSLAFAVWWAWRQEGGQLAAYLPAVAVFVMALRQLLSLMSSTGDAVMGVVAALPYADTVRRALAEPTIEITGGTQRFTALERAIEFVNVSYAHKGRNRTIANASFTLQAQTTTAIVGASGAGKSTIIDLLMRLYDVDGGAIRIDGTDLRQLRLDDWRGAIGLMSQEPFLFNGTIGDNIGLGKVGATSSEIREAAMQADAHSFIEQLPDAYDTALSDRGMTLSGGQRQRIALARALLRKPVLLLLDEATSAVDNRSEQAIKEALSAIRGRCTQVIVAHKLATVRDADSIVVVGDGQILEVGTHDELLRGRGAYARLYQSQAH